MNKSKMRTVQITAEDFSDRDYYPGTDEHPFHVINDVNNILVKIPVLLFPILFGGLFYLATSNLAKTLIWSGAMLLDLLILTLLPRLKISFGPPNLTVVMLGLLRLPFMFFPLPVAMVVQLIGTALMIYGFMIEPQYPVMQSYTVPTNIPGLEDLRIVHLSDLHMAYFSQLEKRIIRKVNALQPDLVLFSGDFFNLSQRFDPQTAQDIGSFFTQIKSEYGIYASTGSPSVDLTEAFSNLGEDPGFTLLDKEVVSLEIDNTQIKIYGLSCTHRPHVDLARFSEMVQAHPISEGYNILLYHSPDLAPAVAGTGIDMQLSGHTHGGQVQLPFFGPIYAASLYGLRLAQGHYQVNDALNLIVSHGIGLEGDGAPRVRFLSPPEIGLISFDFREDNVELDVSISQERKK
ncbi:metallophosphoesterase [bacterium]|nr:metallophosphoesterase [bacterium]